MSAQDLEYAFRMAEWRIERANNHISHLEEIVQWIVHPDHYGIFTEQDPETGNYGIRVGPKETGLPHHLPIVMGEITHHLAASLDYLWSGLARSAGMASDRRVHFPRHERWEELKDMVSNAKVVAKFSSAEGLILDRLRPYKDGNFALWVIGKLDNIDKHRLLLSCMTIGKLGKFVARAEDGSVIDLSYSTINSDGPFLTLGFAAPFKLNDDAELTPLVAFNEPELIAPGQPVLETMVNLAQASAEAVQAFRETFP